MAVLTSALYQALGRYQLSASPWADIDTQAWYTGLIIVCRSLQLYLVAYQMDVIRIQQQSIAHLISIVTICRPKLLVLVPCCLELSLI